MMLVLVGTLASAVIKKAMKCIKMTKLIYIYKLKRMKKLVKIKSLILLMGSMKTIVKTLIILLCLAGVIGLNSCGDDDEPGLSTETDVLSFTVPDQVGDSYIDNELHVIGAQVAEGTNLSNLAPSFTLSEAATSSPASGATGDYTNQVMITVTAEDGTTSQDWIVKVFDDTDATIICDESLCASDETRKQDCITFLVNCIEDEPEANHDECVITALAICNPE